VIRRKLVRGQCGVARCPGVGSYSRGSTDTDGALKGDRVDGPSYSVRYIGPGAPVQPRGVVGAIYPGQT